MKCVDREDDCVCGGVREYRNFLLIPQSGGRTASFIHAYHSLTMRDLALLNLLYVIGRTDNDGQ